MAEERSQNIVGVVEQYGRRLFNFIRGRVKTDADAEDILQEVWYQFSRVVNTEPIEQLSGWLFRVARNRITDNYRKQKPLSLGSLTFEDEDGELNFNDILFSEEMSPEMEDLKEVFWEELFRALDELPEKQRQVFVWNELEDQTFQEIADRTGENIKTLISRKGYAVKHLRNRLENLYDEFLNY
ncbi:MAG: sigma-70 family RNA polymerase sigma factor [Bacteroidetes bacterium]|nr:MAG: sigma-70 family RNA polymerase sigma factor [Bacteroidota bacterium]